MPGKKAVEAEERLANSPNILIIILIQTQRATRMLHKQLQDTDFVLFDLWHFFIHGVGDEVTAS